MVMKRLFFLTLLIAALTWPALAQNAPTSRPVRGQRGDGPVLPRLNGPNSRPASGPVTRPGPRPPRVELNALIDSLDLTPEQRAQVEHILAAQRQEAEKFLKENGPTIQALEGAIRQARENKDAAALKGKQEELVKLLEARGKLHEQLMTQLADVLTAEQMQQVRDALDQMRQQPALRALAGLAGLNLSDEQKQRARAILDEAAEKARTADPAERDRLFQVATAKIHAEVLTAEQREQAQRSQNRLELFGMLRGLHLTPEQHEQIQAIHETMTKQLESADTLPAKREIVESAMRDVTTNVLTKEQREQLETFRSRGDRGRGDRVDQSPPPLEPLERLKLTDEQRKQIEKIRQDSADARKNTKSPQEQREAMRSAMTKIRDVLTDEQRARLEELRPASRPARR